MSMYKVFARRMSLCRVLIWVLVIFILLQFFNYDWNILNLHLFTSSKREKDSARIWSTEEFDRPKIGDNVPIDDKNERVDFRIIVVTYNRNASLHRLLESLNGVDYMGDKAVVEVWIDRSKKSGQIHEPTYIAAMAFQFKHGILNVHNHTKHAGIYGQWMDTWHPSSKSSEIALILEDDITVSPHVYRWLKNVHRKYDKTRTDIAGYSLQGKSMKHGGGSGNLHAPDENVCFLYPVLGSWGFSPKRENWMKYVDWYKKMSLNKTFLPYVEIPGFLPTVWYKLFIKQGKTDSMWTMWHIYYTFSQKELVLYPNIPGYKGLTVNWQEAGLHYKKSQTISAGPLLTEWDSRFDNLPDDPIQLDIKGSIRKQFG